MCLNGLFGSGKRDSPDSLGDEAAHFERLLFYGAAAAPAAANGLTSFSQNRRSLWSALVQAT